MGKTITNVAELKQAIINLEQEIEIDELALKNQFQIISTKLRPMTLVKSLVYDTFNNFSVKSDWGQKITESVAGFLFSSLLFRNLKPVFRTALSIAGSSLLSYIFKGDKTALTEKIKEFIRQFTEGKSEGKEFDEKDIYRQ